MSGVELWALLCMYAWAVCTFVEASSRDTLDVWYKTSGLRVSQ